MRYSILLLSITFIFSSCNQVSPPLNNGNNQKIVDKRAEPRFISSEDDLLVGQFLTRAALKNFEDYYKTPPLEKLEVKYSSENKELYLLLHTENNEMLKELEPKDQDVFFELILQSYIEAEGMLPSEMKNDFKLSFSKIIEDGSINLTNNAKAYISKIDLNKIEELTDDEYEKVFNFYGVKLGMTISEAIESLDLVGHRMFVDLKITSGNIYLGLILKYQNNISQDQYSSIDYKNKDWKLEPIVFNGGTFGSNAFKFIDCPDGYARLEEIMFIFEQKYFEENKKSIIKYFKDNYQPESYKLVEGDTDSYIESFSTPIHVLFLRTPNGGQKGNVLMSEISLSHSELIKFVD